MELSINHVSKRYRGNIWGLRDFDLSVQPGVLVLLGPNGAGKSTLMRILATITQPTEGNVTWKGVDIARRPNVVRQEIGYLPQDFGVYPNLNVTEFLEYLAALKGIDRRTAQLRIEELLVLVNLFNVRKRPLGSYSGGMKQRVGIAQALLNDPKLLIVDEPTVGLDPEERVRFRNLLSDLAGERIVILSTHIVSDAESVATRIAVIHKGSMLESTSPEVLMQRVQGKVWQMTVSSSELVEVRKRYLVSSTARRSEGMQVRIISDQPPSGGASPVLPTLEEAYLELLESANHVGAKERD